jgi:VIT1/CCC1 family predicted Fe2+/Mn2+ transporter
MSTEGNPPQEASGSRSRELGDAPKWEDAPARTASREGTAGRRSPAEPESTSSETTASTRREQRRRRDSPNMLPGRQGRLVVERQLVRLVATGGIVAIGVAIGAIMVSSGSDGWLVGLVVSVVSVVLAAILWSSRTL